MNTRKQVFESGWDDALDRAYRKGWAAGTADRLNGGIISGQLATGPLSREYLQGYRYGSKGLYGDSAP